MLLLFDPHSLGVSWVPGSVLAPTGKGDAGLALGWPEEDTDRYLSEIRVGPGVGEVPGKGVRGSKARGSLGRLY